MASLPPRLFYVPARVARRLLDAGPAATLRWAWHELVWRYREWSLDIDTRGLIPAAELSADPDANEYEPISYQALETAFRHLGVRPGEDVFLDYGAGMGRAVVLAATHPFRRVLGVEINAELCGKAEDNVRRAGRRLSCPSVEVVHADAKHFAVPDDVTCVLLFNSFGGATLTHVLERLRESLQRTPRPLALLYMRPVGLTDPLAACPWLQRERELPTGWCAWVSFAVYRAREVVAASA